MKTPKNEARMGTEERLAIVETHIGNINTTLVDIRQEMKGMRSDMNAMRAEMNGKFDAIQNRMWSNFLWVMGLIIGLAGLIAHTQHWI